MTSGQARFPVAPSKFKFTRHGQCGTWVSELLPHTAKIVDDIALIKTVSHQRHQSRSGLHLRHDRQRSARQGVASAPGWRTAWAARATTCPAFVVLTPRFPASGQRPGPLHAHVVRGFLPTRFNGVALRGTGDPVLYVQNPPGVSGHDRRAMLDALGRLNQRNFERLGDPETQTRIAQYEMAFRMQTSVPELVDLGREPQRILDLYGPDVRDPGHLRPQRPAWPAGWSSAASGSCRSCTAAGTSTATCHAP